MKIISKIITVSIIGITASALAPMVFADTTNPDNFVPTLGPTTTEDTAIIPNTGGDNSAEASSTLVPNNGGTNDTEGGTTLVPNGSGSNGDEIGTTTTTSTTTASTTDSTPPAPETPNVSDGGGSSGSSGTIVPTIFASTTASTTTALSLNSCPLITTFMQANANNNSGDVTKLQTFLKNVENLNVDITGIFDTNTVAAVKAFQAKYLADTMGPWKSATPSGSVFITTKRKINEIACNSTITLTPEEISIINSHNQNPPVIGSNTTGTTTPVVGPTIGEGTSTNSNNTANTASVINAPILNRVWNFFKGLF